MIVKPSIVAAAGGARGWAHAACRPMRVRVLVLVLAGPRQMRVLEPAISSALDILVFVPVPTLPLLHTEVTYCWDLICDCLQWRTRTTIAEHR